MSLRTRRTILRAMGFVLGLFLIVGGVLLPLPVRFQIVSVILGLLLYQTMLLRVFDRFLPNERKFLALREETDRLLDLVRDLNQAAVAARALGMDRDQYVSPIVRRMHETVDKLPRVAAERVEPDRFRPWLPEKEAELRPPDPDDEPRMH